MPVEHFGVNPNQNNTLAILSFLFNRLFSLNILLSFVRPVYLVKNDNRLFASRLFIIRPPHAEILI